MADRFPLIVNSVSKKIEELISGDNLELTGNGVTIGGSQGQAEQYLKSNGTTVEWGNPGDVYTTATQTLSNKTLELCILNGAVNQFANIPNAALVNSTITVNGSTVNLGDSFTTPDNNTTYTIQSVDAVSPAKKIIRLTSGGTASAVNQDITLEAGTNMSVSRTGNTIIFESSFTDTNTVTTVESAVGGSAVTGAVVIAASGACQVSQAGQIITINGTDTNTFCQLRAAGNPYSLGNFTSLAGNTVTVTQGVDASLDPTITISSTDTITRVKGGTTGTLVSGDITIVGNNDTTVSQSGNTITISSTDIDTVTRVRGTNTGTYQSGDITILGAGDATVSQSGNTITVSTTDTNTTYSAFATGGLSLAGTEFSVKNYANLNGNKVMKWDSGNTQFVDSIISDDGASVTIGGNLIVDGTTTTLNTQTLVVEDNLIELRKGSSLSGTDSGIQINRTTDAAGAVLTFARMEWYDAGSYWRTYDGSVANRLVTENETQILTNKTLSNPTLTTPILGVATATSINGLAIATTASSTLSIANVKSIGFNNSVTFAGTDGSTVDFRTGGNLAYTNDTLAVFQTTTSTQLRGVVSDSTGVGVLCFNQNTQFINSIGTQGASISVFNANATSAEAFGAATQVIIGANSGTTTINHGLDVALNCEFGTDATSTFEVKGTANFDNADISIRSSSGNPIYIGRGGNAIASNTRVGYDSLNNITTGSQNTAFGYECLLVTNAGAANTAFGYRAGRATGTGSNNVYIGRDSGLTGTDASRNIGIGNNALYGNETGDQNVCIGHFAGYGVINGNGNVLIGPATSEDSTSVTYQPPVVGGDNQLVIGSGSNAWITGNAQFDVTMPGSLTVSGSTTINGDLVVQGTTVSINSNVVAVDDKAIELAAVVNTTFSGDVSNGSNIITNCTPVVNLTEGMVVLLTTADMSIPADTFITDITGTTITLSASITITGGGTTGSFDAQGPSDQAASGGGIILKGTPQSSGGTGDKTILYDHSRTDKYWTFSENIEVAFGKKFVIGNQLALDSTTLGSTVVNSSLESVGTLQGLDVDGATTLGGRVVEKVFNSFNTTLTPSANVLSINVAGANTILGQPATTAINEFAFTGCNLTNGQSITITLILTANSAATYGDACSVDGTSILNGIKWSGGSPPTATSNIDILTFIIVQDTSGTVQVFGQGNTDFS